MNSMLPQKYILNLEAVGLSSNAINFLKELFTLYQKYNLVIDSCGCCSSPFISLSQEESQHLKSNYINYVSKHGFYLHFKLAANYINVEVYYDCLTGQFYTTNEYFLGYDESKLFIK